MYMYTTKIRYRFTRHSAELHTDRYENVLYRALMLVTPHPRSIKKNIHGNMALQLPS